MRDTGTSVVVVEQRVDRALAFADRAVVLDTGEVTTRTNDADAGKRPPRPGQPSPAERHDSSERP